MKKAIPNSLLLLLIILSFNHSCTQKNQEGQKKEEIEINENPERSKLTGRTFKGKVGSIYVDTIPMDSCAGSEIFLIMNFKKDLVEMTEEQIGFCGKIISKDHYLSPWNIKNNQVSVNKMTRYGEPLILKKLLLDENNLSGSETDQYGNEPEYVFAEVE